MPTSEMAKLFTADGPFATVYADTQAVTQDSLHQLELRRRSLRERLLNEGADEATADAAITALQPDGGRTGQLVVAAHGQVLLSRHLPAVVERDVAAWQPLPCLTPLLSATQAAVPHVVVLADRTGADIMAYYDGRTPVRVEEVSGSHDVVEKVQAGGWSQLRYQHRAEDSWEGNAREVAEQVGRIVDDVKARIVLLNGDVRAVQYVLDHLPEAVRPLAKVIDEGGGRAVDGSAGVIAERVTECVAAKAAAELEALLATFQEERGQGDRAADGVPATVQALQQGKVGCLLVHDDPDDARTAWFGPEPTQIATDAQALVDMNVDAPVESRLVDVAVRAALGTSADVRIVPPGGKAVPKDGIGAILRW